MSIINEIKLDIENEIKLKRLNPEYLSELLERDIEIIESKFYSSFSEILEYRNKFKEWKNEVSRPNKQLEIITKKITRAAELGTKIMEREKSNKDCSKLDIELNEIISFVENNEIDFSGWSDENFDRLDELILNRKRILAQTEIGGLANSGLLNNKLFKALISLSVFTISFLLSFWVGDFIEEKVKVLGPIISKLLPALLFFFLFDKLVQKIETCLTWKRVCFLNQEYHDIVLNINQQTIILTELQKKLSEQNQKNQ